MSYGSDYSSVILFWIVGALVVGMIGSSRGKGFWGPFFISAILSPLIGLIVVLVSGDGQKRAPCWQCKEMVVVGALKCAHCGAALVWPGTPTAP